MTLNANDLKDKIKSDLSGLDDPADTLNTLGQSLSDYIKDNAVLNFSWNGIDGGGNVDPVIATTGGIVDLNIVISASMADNPTAAIESVASDIWAGIKAGKINVTETGTGFNITAGAMADCPALILAMAGEEDQDPALLNFSEQIINWLKLYKPVAILLGSHGAFAAPPGVGATPSSFFS